MVGLLLAFQVAAAPPPPLDSAHGMLLRGDTVHAVLALRSLVTADTVLSSDALAAALVLQWLSRGPGQRRADSAWDAIDDRMRHAKRRGAADEVLYADARVTAPSSDDATVRLTVGGGRWDRALASIRERYARVDPLLAGAAAWASAQGRLNEVRSILDRQPIEDAPSPCRLAAESCLRRMLPLPGETLRGVLQGAQPSPLAPLLADLAAAREAPWPYAEFGARIRVLVLALIGDSAGLAAVEDDTAGLDPVTARSLRVIVAEFSGRRHQAWRVMQEDTAAFTPLDRERRYLAGALSSPDVFWRVSWPLFLEPYNARLVAHRARVLLADLLGRAGPDFGSGPFGSYGRPDELVRRGIPLAMVTAKARDAAGEAREIVVQYLPPGFHETLVRSVDPSGLPSLDLALAARDPERLGTTISGFEALDYDQMLPFDHQVVQLQRSGERIVDVSALRPATLGCTRSSARVGVFVLDARLALTRQLVRAPEAAESRFRFRMPLAAGTYVYSLEYLDRACRVAARGRFVLEVRPPAGVGLSDLALADDLLLTEPARVPDDARAVARPSLTVPAGEVLQFYWEMYGLDAAAAGRRLDVALEVVTVANERVPVTRLDDVARAARGEATLGLAYDVTVPAGTGPIGMGVVLRLVGAAGVYVARLRVTDAKTGAVYRAERAFSVVGGG